MQCYLLKKNVLHYLKMLLILIFLYLFTGKLGLLLALPPGYATVIWPPSGIALGMLILYGRRLWPGVLIGSFLLNCYISHALSFEDGVIVSKLAAAFGIAVGSTLQAVTGRWLVKRFLGIPLAFHQVKEIITLFWLCGPLSCLIAATIGVATLFSAGAFGTDKIVDNWATWWLGDMFGVFVFLPLTLIAPGSEDKLKWKTNTIGGLPLIALLTVLIPLGLTFYGWNIASESNYEKQKNSFQSLASENEKALLDRLNSYEQLSKGAAAFFNASDFVSRNEWTNYIKTIDIPNNYPGINGLGIIVPVERSQVNKFAEDIQEREVSDFKIHPATKDKPYYIIKYIEPSISSRTALGLNIAFEKNRLEAANLAINSGKPVLSKKIILVQTKAPGFLLFNPIYNQKLPAVTVQERQKAHVAWVYAPFIVNNLFKDLTNSESNTLNIKIYENANETPENLIFSSNVENASDGNFKVRKNIEVLQQKWLVEWSSTKAFDISENDNFPFLIIVGGIAFTGLLGIFLISVSVRRNDMLQLMSGKKGYALPVIIFCISCVGSYNLYLSLEEKQSQQIRNTVEAQSEKINVLIKSHANDALLAIDRMAKRWDAADGTPKDQWQKDTDNYIKGISGLKAVEWVDPRYKIRWVEPLNGNEKVLGLNILFNANRENALRGAAERNAITLTPPLDLVQGYKAFIAYAPVHRKGKFDGFIAAIFPINDFFNAVVTNKEADAFSIKVEENGKEIYAHELKDQKYYSQFKISQSINLYDKNWQVIVEPTKEFVESKSTPLEEIIFAASLLISALAAFASYSIILTRARSNNLAEVNRLNKAIMDSAAYLVIATDKNGKIVSFNKAAEKALGYSAENIINKQTPALWHDGNEVFDRALKLSDELGRKIEPDFNVFIERLRTQSSDTYEWTFISKSGRRFPVNLTATALKGSDGEVTGYLGVIEDITAKKAEEEKRWEIEEKLRLSEEGLQLGLQGTGVGMWDWDVPTNTIFWSDRFNALLGYAPHELPTHYIEWENRLHPDDKFNTIEALQEYLNQKADEYDREYRLLTQEGEWRWFRATGIALRNDDGSPRRMVGSLEDIHGRKIAQEALYEAHEFNRLIVEANPDFIFVKDSEFRIVSANSSFFNIYPESARHEIIGKTTLEKYSPDEAEKFLSHDREALEKGITENFEKVTFPNGEVKHLFTIKTRFYNFKSEAFILGISRDVTTLMKAEEDRESLMRSLTRSNTELERFAYIASHDMQEPIRMVTNFSRIISDDYKAILDDTGQEYLKLIVDAGVRMSDMVNDLLSYSKLGNENAKFNLFSGEEVFLSAEKNLYELIKDKNAIISHSKLPDFFGNPIQIIRLFQNLLANAIKYQTGDKKPEIYIEVVNEEENWLVSIKDNGVGIKPEFVSEIFQPFRRLHTWEEAQGTGLGLSICQKIVENHGGKIWVTSTPGEGSIFYFTLPKAN